MAKFILFLIILSPLALWTSYFFVSFLFPQNRKNIYKVGLFREFRWSLREQGFKDKDSCKKTVVLRDTLIVFGAVLFLALLWKII